MLCRSADGSVRIERESARKAVANQVVSATVCNVANAPLADEPSALRLRIFNEMEKERNIVLSIETAVEGGSLALFEGETEIDSWTGTKEVSKAEDILESISILLEKNNIEKKQITSIKVSNGQGSATGIKIGLAIAKGLGSALEIKIEEVSTSEALLEEADGNIEGIIITVLPIGKNLISRQIFDRVKGFSRELDKSLTLSIEEFGRQIKSINYKQIIFHQKAFEYCEALLDSNEQIKVLSKVPIKQLASLIVKKKE